jgi:hypothetical protein
LGRGSWIAAPLKMPPPGDQVYSAFGFQFELTGSATPLVDELRWLLANMTAQNPSDQSSLIAVDERRGGRFQLMIDDEPRFETGNAGVMANQVVWEITRRAVATRPDSLVLHAGAVIFDDALVVVSGRSGAGKSTLVAALVEAGGAYVTDEALMLDGHGHIVEALPRPLQLDGRSRELLRVPHRGGRPTQVDGSYYLPVADDRVHRSTFPATPLVVFLDGHGEAYRVDFVPKSRAVARLIGEAFDSGRCTQAGLESAAALVELGSFASITGGNPSIRVAMLRDILNGNMTVAPLRPR